MLELCIIGKAKSGLWVTVCPWWVLKPIATPTNLKATNDPVLRYIKRARAQDVSCITHLYLCEMSNVIKKAFKLSNDSRWKPTIKIDCHAVLCGLAGVTWGHTCGLPPVKIYPRNASRGQILLLTPCLLLLWWLC